MKKSKINFQGFTLIELMLVIAIISLLASVAMFSGTEARKKAQDAKMISESHQVETAIALYKENHDGEVPYDVNVATGKVYQEGGPDNQKYIDSLQPLVTEKLLPSVPKSPDGKSYSYGVSSDKKEAIFVADLKVSKSNKSNSSSNSCDFIKPSLPTNCTFDHAIIGGDFVSCTLYRQQNPDKLCYTGEDLFCSEWNQTGDFEDLCFGTCTLLQPGQRLCVGPGCNFCDTYGGVRSGVSLCVCSEGLPCDCDFAHAVCDAPAETVCSDDSEYCSCVK